MRIKNFKLIYIEINRAASNSIVSNFGFEPTHHDIEHYHDNVVMDGEVWSEQNVVAVVRNPWDRLLSQFTWWDDFEHIIRRGATFDYFIKHLDNPSKWCLDASAYDPKFVGNQYDWLTLNEELSIDYIGRHEALQKTLDYIGNLMGFTFQISHTRKTEHRPYQEHYNSVTREIVAERFQKDIEKFNYTFN